MDKVEIFGNVAHNLVPKVENLLLEVVEITDELLSDFVKAIQIAAEKIEKQVKREKWSTSQAENFFKQYRKLAIIAMAGHQCFLGKEGQVNALANQMTDLFKRKNADYGDSFGKSMRNWVFV